MTKQENLTAKEYLNDDRFGPLTKALEEEHPSAIAHTLIGKGWMEANILQPGQYTFLVTIIRQEYPDNFHSWLNTTTQYLLDILTRNESLEMMQRHRETTFPIQLRNDFQQIDDFNKLEKWFVWYDADDL